MKILFYSPVNLISGGGCERWHCDVTTSMRKLGHDVTIATGTIKESAKWSNEYLEEQLDGTQHIVLKYFVLFGVLIPTPSVLVKLYRLFKSHDAVHFIYGFMGQDIIISIIKKLTGKPVLVGHHAPIFHVSKIHNLYMKLVSRYLLNIFDFHQTLNARDKKFFEEKWGVRNVHFIPSGIKVNAFLNAEKKNHEGLIFLAVGRYENQKGIDLALPAIRKLNEKYPDNDMEFRFVGDGSQKDLIDEYSSNYRNIKNFGYTQYDKLPGIYSSSDVYFLPSREEPFGLVLIEAWSSGIPVLATRTEGPSDMLKENINGWFIKEITTEEVFNSLEKVYLRYKKEGKNFLSIMENECRKSGAEYSIDNCAKRMADLMFHKLSPND